MSTPESEYVILTFDYSFLKSASFLIRAMIINRKSILSSR